MPRRDVNRVLDGDPEVVDALAFLKTLSGVRGVVKGHWIRLPHSRLAGGTIVPIGPEGQTLKAKLYTKWPDTGYLPLTLYCDLKVSSFHQIQSLLSERNVSHATSLRESKALIEETPQRSRFSNVPKLEIAQPSPIAEPPPIEIAQPRPTLVPPKDLVTVREALEIAGFNSKASFAYHVKQGHIVAAKKGGGRGIPNLYHRKDVEALRVRASVGAPPGGHQKKALITVEDKLDRMIDLLSEVLKANQILVERWS